MSFLPGNNSANFNLSANWDNQNGNVTTVGTNGGPSAYGTYDQAGNVWEWNESLNDFNLREVRGGVWYDISAFASNLSSSGKKGLAATVGTSHEGFRIASINNPLNLKYFVDVTISNNTANPPDINGLGSVNYNYKIAQYTVTNCQYAEFLNAIAATDTYNLYNTYMALPRGGITRSGSSGSYTYAVKNNYGNKPVIYITWLNAARYCNWLHNNKLSGAQNNTTTEDGAYTLNGATSEVGTTRNISAKYFIPTRNEWYKAAYYTTNKFGSPGYWKYATQSDQTPEPLPSPDSRYCERDPGPMERPCDPDLSRLRSYLDGGNGPFASMYDCSESIASPPGPPRDLNIFSNYNSLELIWTVPSYAGTSPIINYTIKYLPNGGTESLLSTTGTLTSYILNGLLNNTNYTVSVAAVNNIGTGQYCSPSSGIPLSPTVSLPPLSLTVKPIDSGLKLAWQPPSNNGGTPITGYVTQYTPSGLPTETINIGNAATGYIISGLLNNVEHTVRVAPLNSAGTGLYSSVIKKSPGRFPISTTFPIDAKQNWQKTDAYVCELLTIDVSGLVNCCDNDPNSWYGPDGNPCGSPNITNCIGPPWQGANITNDYKHESVIGKIGLGGNIFFVGSSYSGYPGTGYLYLATNDTVREDNNGGFTAYINSYGDCSTPIIDSGCCDCGLFNNTFDNIGTFSDYSVMAQVEENLKAYLDYSFLNIGGFVNVSSGNTIYAINNTKTTVSQASYVPGKTWETYRKDWVYETGVSYNGVYPTRVSGVVVNSIFLPTPTGSGAYGFKLDYPNGQIIFNKPIPTGSKVSINHSYRKCQVYKSSTTNWWGEFRNAIYSDLPNDYALQTPAIVIEPTDKSALIPYQLGDRSFFVDQDMLLYIFADSAIERNNLVDKIRLQKEKTLLMYDINKVIKSGVYPISYDGQLNNNGQSYIDLLSNPAYCYLKLFIKDVNIMGMESYSKKLFWCILRLTTQTIL